MGRSVEPAGVLDKVVSVLGALEAGPRSLQDLAGEAGLARATAHRLAVRLEGHGLVRRLPDGRFALGLRLVGLGRAAADGVPLRALAQPVLQRLRDDTGESVQLYVPEPAGRRCLVSLQSPHGLRWIVPEGALLPMERGSAGRVLSAAGESAGESAGGPGSETAGTAGRWVASVEEREPGVASVSAPVRDATGRVVAAVSVSGPVERLSRDPGARFGETVVAAADRLGAALLGPPT